MPCYFKLHSWCYCAMCFLTFTDSVQAVSFQKPSVIPPLVPSTRREDDILFQWRLRRKIEQAREWPRSLQHSSLHGPTFSWQMPSLNHPSDRGQAYKVEVIVYDIYSTCFLLNICSIFTESFYFPLLALSIGTPEYSTS